MKTQIQSIKQALIAAAGLALASHALAAAAPNPHLLWYRAPAVLTNWTEALPIGNGRLGAMIFGGVERERIQLNEDTLWAGCPYDPVNTNALGTLPEVRRLIFDGRYADAQKLVADKMMSIPLRQMPYETIGDLMLEFPARGPVTEYRRDLNLDTAVAHIEYVSDGVRFTREIFSSPVDQVIVIRLAVDKPRQLSFKASFRTPQKAVIETEGQDTLVLRGTNAGAYGIPGALKFQSRVRVVARGGKVAADGTTLSVTGADSALLFVAAGTAYKTFKDISGDPGAVTTKQIRSAARKSIDSLRSAHVKEHQRLFQRVQMDLGQSEAMTLPTDERIKRFAEGKDPQLAALYFQFARYLLICSSRPGTQPANLQGIWNDSMNPPWGSKYTININTEMNYWPADSGNLGECIEPLTAMVLDLTETGARTAQVAYGARGWVAHHNTDLWRASGPIDGPNSGMWPTGGAWLCQNLWDHYLYTMDKKYLARIYPAMKGASQFFLDTLVEEPKHGWLVTSPSISPENRHSQNVSVCAGPTMDMQILRDLFANTIAAGEILKVDPDLRRQLAATRARLAPLQIGSAGQLQEWLDDWDLKAPDIHHRHVSHLYGLFPGGDIDPRTTPELAAAVKKSLELRGDRATGWATAWRINLWAHLHDGDHAFEILKFLLSPERTYPDLFDAHPPFQIDGNFGGASGIAEMLLQSQKGEIELLPALPKAWPNGKFKGLRARGGFEIDMEWSDGKPTAVTVRSVTGTACKVRYGEQVRELKLKPGSEMTLLFSAGVLK